MCTYIHAYVYDHLCVHTQNTCIQTCTRTHEHIHTTYTRSLTQTNTHIHAHTHSHYMEGGKRVMTQTFTDIPVQCKLDALEF